MRREQRQVVSLIVAAVVLVLYLATGGFLPTSGGSGHFLIWLIWMIAGFFYFARTAGGQQWRGLVRRQEWEFAEIVQTIGEFFGVILGYMFMWIIYWGFGERIVNPETVTVRRRERVR